MNHFPIKDIYSLADERGRISIIQDELPFQVARCFWITDADGQVRGGHRHHVTRQILIAIQGSVEVYMNDGQREETITLSSPEKYLLVEPKDWHTMSFWPKSVLLVLASHKYDPSDYINTPYCYD